MLTTSLEQTAYSDLITRFLGERVIGKFSNEFLQFSRIVRRPACIAARIGNRHHDARPLIRRENWSGWAATPSPPGEVNRARVWLLVPDAAAPVERDHTAERYANDPNAPPSDCVQQGCGVVRIVSHRVGLVWLPRSPEPALVVCKHVKGFHPWRFQEVGVSAQITPRARDRKQRRSGPGSVEADIDVTDGEVRHRSTSALHTCCLELIGE